MNPSASKVLFSKGIRRVLGYYLIGLAGTLIFHLLYGWNYVYAPPVSSMIIVMVLVIGLPWALLNITSLGCPLRRYQHLGELTIHLAVITCSLLAIASHLQRF